MNVASAGDRRKQYANEDTVNKLSDLAIEDLARSGISPEQADNAGMFSVDNASTVYPEFKSLPALVIPYFTLNGQVATFDRGSERLPFCRVRYLKLPSTPGAFTKTKPRRYDQPAGSPVLPYFPLAPDLDWPTIARDSSISACVCEGEKKALAGALRSLPVIGLGGVWNFLRDGGLEGTRGLIPELEAFEWHRRDLYMAMDSDAATNPNIAAAEARLAVELGLRRGANVYRIRIPAGVQGAKQGLDDFIVEHGYDEFLKLADSASKMREADALVADLNISHAVVSTGGKTFVAKFTHDDVQRRNKIDFFSKHDFELMLGNRFTRHPETDKPAPLAKVWLSHPQRREYLNGVAFAPLGEVPEGTLNLWQGFSVEPRPGDWSRLHTHIVENICAGDSELSDYFLNWMARMVQHPDEPGEVAIVMRGGRGVGKGKVASWLGRTLFDHYFHAIQNDDVTGRFNSHLLYCVFLFADEAFFAGDPRNEKVLNGLITEKTRRSEQKFMPLISVPNYLHLMMATNCDWAIPAGLDERRYFVLDVPDHAHKQDSAYFAAIDRQMNSGGLEAMLFDLQQRDLSKFDVRRVPQTDALADQKRLTLHARGGALAWLQDVLTAGEVRFMGDARTTVTWAEAGLLVSRNELYEAYEVWERNRAGRVHGDSRESFGRRLQTALGLAFRGGDNLRLPKNINSQRPRAYAFGTLEECREAFRASQNMPTLWRDEQ